jgi:hypothetical protein
MKKIILNALMLVCVLFSIQAGAASYAYYGSLEDATKEKDWNEVLSYKYAKGKLLIVRKDGKTLDLEDGVYEFNTGEKYVVKDGTVLDKDDKGKDKKSEKSGKKEKRDKLKDLKL